jgi:hypothetical protein
VSCGSHGRPYCQLLADSCRRYRYAGFDVLPEPGVVILRHDVELSLEREACTQMLDGTQRRLMTDHREQLRSIRTFPSLVRFLRDELDWPVETEDFEDLTFDYSPEELGIDAANAAKIEEIKKLRPLHANQPWGIFFVKFEPKRLPVVALRRILAGLVVKKRATASAAEQPKWAEDDLLFISNYGEGDERQITYRIMFEGQLRPWGWRSCACLTLKVRCQWSRSYPLSLAE